MKINFYRFNIPDTDDPDIMVAEPLLAWQRTPHGSWVMTHAHELTYYHRPDSNFWGYDVVVRGELRDSRLVTEYFLRWPQC